MNIYKGYKSTSYLNIPCHILFTLLVSLFLTAGSAHADEDVASSHFSASRLKHVVAFDVSEIPSKFIFDETPLTKDKNGNDVPGDGNEFKTEGYIYLPETLQGDGDGVNPDGSPEYPERVIGRWYCWGFHVGNGGATETGPWVITHQMYDLGDRPGNNSLISAGLELVDINEPIKRAISGGTGYFHKARGEVVQRMIGFNGLQGVNLRFRIRVK